MAIERLHYFTFFMKTIWLVLPMAAAKSKNPILLAPLFPFSIIWTFQYDTCYGSLGIRANINAGILIKKQPERFFLPKGTGILSQEEYNEIVGIKPNY